jgi:hypothetical protein
VVLLGPRRLPGAARNTKRYEPAPFGDGLVVVEGWILRADEAAAVIA